jgi:hypothetical protein
MGATKQYLLEEMDTNERFADLTMKFKGCYKGNFRYQGICVDYTVVAWRSFDDYYDAAQHSVDVDDPPTFGACDEWSAVKVRDKKTGEVVFESIEERW